MLLKLSAIIYLWHFIYFVASRSLENTSLYLVQLSHNRILARVAPKVIESVLCCFHWVHFCNKRITFLCWGKRIVSFVRSICECTKKHKQKRKRKWMSWFWYVTLRTLTCLQTQVFFSGENIHFKSHALFQVDTTTARPACPLRPNNMQSDERSPQETSVTNANHSDSVGTVQTER